MASYTVNPQKTVDHVDDVPTAWVVYYTDGSQDITYKNQPIVDPECQNISTADINAGLVCAYNVGVPGKADYFEQRYIPTERWTGKVQSWGEFRGNMDRAAALNPSYPESARRNIYFNNPSWHLVLGGSVLPDGTRTPDGSSWEYHVLKGEYGALGFGDNFIPTYIGPTTTSGGSTIAIKDPTTDTWIDTTNVRDPNAPLTPDGRTLTDIVYPNGVPRPADPSAPPTGDSAPRANDDSFFSTPDPLTPRVPTGAVAQSVPGSASSSSSPAPSSSGAPPWWVLAGVGVAVLFAMRGRD